MDSGKGHGKLPENGKPHGDDSEEENKNGWRLTFGEAAESRLDRTENSSHSSREQNRKKKKPKPDKKRKPDAIGKTCRQVVNEFLHLDSVFCALNCGTCGEK